MVDGGRSPTTFPRLMTVIVSAIAWTSLSLCEMKMIDRPPSRSSRMIRNRSSVSPGVSTAVGSSRTSTLRVAEQRLDDLDPLLHADRQVLHEGVGVHAQAEPLGELEHVTARPAPVEQAE